MQANAMEPPPPTFDGPDDDGAGEPRCFDCGRYGAPRAELAWKGRPAHIPILERYLIGPARAALLCLVCIRDRRRARIAPAA